MSTDATPASTGGGAPPSTGAAPTGAAPSTGSAPVSTGSGGFVWSEGWRNQLANGSTDPAKELKQLERYESPDQIWRKARELERKMSAGELRPVLGKDATAQEVAAYREAHGIPAKADGYAINLPPGKKVDKADEPFIKQFMAQAHAANYSQTQFDQALASFYGEVDRQDEAIATHHRELEQKTEDTLRTLWGADYRVNKNMAMALLARAPKGFSDRFMNGFLADHTPIKTSVEAWQWLVQMEREINPAATVMPGAGGDVGASIDAEMKALRKKRVAPRNSPEWKEYWIDGGDKRYEQLLSAKAKMDEKAG